MFAPLTEQALTIAAAVNTACERQELQAAARQTTTMPLAAMVILKFAVMMRMGLADPSVMLAAVPDARQLDWMLALSVARTMKDRPQHQALLAGCEMVAQTMVDHLNGRVPDAAAKN